MKRLVVWLLAVVMLSSGAAQAEVLPALYDVRDVAANDVLNIRAMPNAGAEKVGELGPYAVGVEVTRLSDDGKWGLVPLGEVSGWTAMRYLVRQPGPDWTALSTPMNCYGTEPFWSVSITPAQGMVVLRPMDGAALDLSMDWAMGAVGRLGTVGIGLTGPERTGFATLDAEVCSDGMSDREAGISLSLFLRGEETVGYKGCCSLSP